MNERMSNLVVTVREGERVCVVLDMAAALEYVALQRANGAPDAEHLVLEISPTEITHRRATVSFRAFQFLKVLRGKLYRRSA
jgi:hypothetical protein